MKKYLFILFCGIILFKINNFKSIKICLCTIGKKENLYAREFVSYYKSKGITKIFIYDNNDKNGEKFDIVLKDFIDEGFVEIIDIRGVEAPQIEATEDCRIQNFKKFDWLIFYDMDEFIFLRNHSNIIDFLNQKKFRKCQRIQLNWIFHTDNNLLYYDNRTLKDRFPEIDKRWRGKKIGGAEGIKSILRGNLDFKIHNIHVLNSSLRSCDGFGNIKKVHGIITDESDHYYNYISLLVKINRRICK